MGEKDIIHLDMDAFYPAVEVLDNPDLKGKPVIVGGIGHRGVVSSASYEARKYGVHSAQPITTARRLCPQGLFLPVRMSRYQEVSDSIFEIFRRFTPQVEPLSIDEAFLDVTGCRRLMGTPEEIARSIKKMVQKEIGLTVSAGVAPSKLVAKIASDLDKPDGLTVVEPDRVTEFLDPLPIGKLWGVGRTTAKALTLLGVQTIGDLRILPFDMLEKKFGLQGVHLYRMARGLDERDVQTERTVKSVGREETLSRDILDPDLISKELLSLAVQTARRLRQKGFTGRTITLKVKYHDFVQITRSVTVPEPTNDHLEIFKTVQDLLKETQAGRKPIRLLGISLSRLSRDGGQEQLSFVQVNRTGGRGTNLNTALDEIVNRFGEGAVLPGSLLEDQKRDK